MCGRIYDLGMALYSPLVSLALRNGVSTLCGAVSTLETTVLVPGLVEL